MKMFKVFFYLIKIIFWSFTNVNREQTVTRHDLVAFASFEKMWWVMCVEESIMNIIVIFVFNFRLFLLSHFVEKKTCRKSIQVWSTTYA